MVKWNQDLFIKTIKEQCQTRISNIVVDLVKFAELEADIITWGRGEGHGTMTFKCKSIDYGVIPLFHLTSNGQIKFPLNLLKQKITRKEIVKELDLKGYLSKSEQYLHKVGVSERTKEVIEPRLSDQWFLKMLI